jgi:hypothetical protein
MSRAVKAAASCHAAHDPAIATLIQVIDICALIWKELGVQDQQEAVT